MRTTRTAAAVLLAGAALALAGCGGGDPLAAGSGDASAAGDGSVVIGSADFAESQIIATIYSQALQHAGVEVTERMSIGSREVYVQALQDGSIDLVPDYAGSLLLYLDQDATATSTDEVVAALDGVLPEGLTMLDASPAEDRDVLTVTADTAAEHDLTTVSDLAPVAGDLVLGGPPEWTTRMNGVVGLEQVYGLEFADFLSLDAGGPLTLSALRSGQIQVADMFSTDPAFDDGDLVALDDDQDLFAAENVVPVLDATVADATVTEVLDRVSAALTTDDLVAMNARAADGEALATIATDWLTEKGLLA